MQNLSHYNAAAFLTDGMKDGPQFARVTKGARAGTIGQIVEINCKFYSSHSYRIKVKGRRQFWVKGEDLAHVPGYTGETQWVNNDEYLVRHTDMLGIDIEEGTTLLFHRVVDGRTEMVIGTVKKISRCGAVYVKAFKTARSEAPEGLIKVGLPSSSMVMNGNTMTQVMLTKLSM